MRLGKSAFVLAGLPFAVVIALAAHDDAYDFPYIPMDHPSIEYATRPADDPVGRLQQRIENGEVKLEFQAGKGGFLPAILKILQINPDSQMLVFAKTSFQAPKISPKEPRALYFNDNVAVGFVHDSDVMEFAAFDPKQGVIFYTMDPEKSGKDKAPRAAFLRRTDECLSCHLIPGTLNIPGLVASSVIASPQGSIRFPGAGLIVDSRTPISDRWGGWYVTGATGAAQNRGNAVAPYPDRPDMLDLRGTQNLTSLDSRFDTNTYLAPTSDIVALMTLEHQTRMTNLIIRLGWETRIAEHDHKLPDEQKRLDFVTDELVAYMLFAGEAKIYEPITGVSTFTKTFPERGPRDKQGRSLRDFDLHKRLFRYPLSYMIYSESFDALPRSAKQGVYRRLYEVLSGTDNNGRFAYLDAPSRQAILDILRDTKADLPAYWNAAGSATAR